jgi:hypothetical protein
MKSVATAILFIAIFGATSISVYAQKVEEVPNQEKPVNSSTQPYLFFLDQNGGDLFIVYEQWPRKKVDDSSMLTVRRKVGGKDDQATFTAKVEALNDGVCSFRILDGFPTVAKAWELLGIKTNFFDIRFRDDPGKMPKILLSVKDSQISEQVGTVQPATSPESKSEGGDKPQPESERLSR